METNVNVEVDSKLRQTAEGLLGAAHAFWEEHQRYGGPRAVVWLSDHSGHLIVFTRGEYRDQLLRNIQPVTRETPLSAAFEIPDAPPLAKLPKHLGCTIDHNPHKLVYQSVQEYEADFLARGYAMDWLSGEERAKAIKTDELWELHWYPETPVGFFRLFAATLDRLVEAVND